MAVTVRIPTQLRNLSGGASEVSLDGATVNDVLKNLDVEYPGFGARIFDGAGALRRFVNVFLAEEDIRFMDGVNTAVSEGQVLSIVPAVAGG